MPASFILQHRSEGFTSCAQDAGQSPGRQHWSCAICQESGNLSVFGASLDNLRTAFETALPSRAEAHLFPYVNPPPIVKPKHLILNGVAPTDGDRLLAGVFEHITPSSMQTLQQLHLNLQLTHRSGPGGPLLGLSHGLTCLPVENNLKVVSINTSIAASGLSITKADPWRRLDRVLGDQKRFPYLERIQILVKVEGASRVLLMLLDDMPKDCFYNMEKICGTKFKFHALAA